MHVDLHPRYADDAAATEASGLISACVHCGFCLATCPTYLDSGDERDSPRGRIYLLKQLLEAGEAGPATRRHLDRCLTCRSCETTCPSGMQYGKLLDIGRGMIETEAPRPFLERAWRRALRLVFSRPALFAMVLRPGQWLRPLLPPALARKIPAPQTVGPRPDRQHARRMLVLEGCVQGAATPATNAAATRLLDSLGISLVAAPRAGCCGAVNYHLGAHQQGLDNMRANIDAWWPEIEAGAEAIVSSATGCGSMIADYGKLLASDPAYADKAERIAQLHKDIAQVIATEGLAKLKLAPDARKIAVHVPCSQQHALGQGTAVTDILQGLGFQLAVTRDDHLCCGSAGTYSILQRERSERLRRNKLAALETDKPALIVTANVGCQLHLGEDSSVPVRHWVEFLDEVAHGGR
ncbi:glycolate oxidase subunit GlcF [Pseudohalioglobus lutimaris]|uniref:Glycolate oxidase iron-sulfur subunit n=1 Tax=Pseudohalioglobus lutimaris TaxID=1737061 RepID=A0A2N5WY37_9GAMM|nr:glycolate oxidase subunit GlcF [Pseudohalioglobus lutimaris]PLW67152.1 glycolate oxidase iron-sulfur subunit [Pseudohalioglobus lutimaris]